MDTTRVKSALAKAGPLVPALALVLVALWSTCRVVGAGAGVPGDAAWARAAALVREQHRPGELIVFAPGWIDPVGRLHLGDLIPIEMAARLDAGRYGVVYELSIRGARAPETAGLRPVWSREVGGVTVRRFERTPEVLVTDLVARAGEHGVESDAATQVVLAEVGFAPHRCLQIVPGPSRTATVTFPAVELGTTLVGGVGLADVFKRRQVRTPVEVTVAIGGADLASARAGVDDGWVRLRAATTPGRQDLTVRVRVLGPAWQDRLVCLALEARR